MVLGNYLGTVLDRVSIGVKRQHDHSNSHKGKHLTGWLTEVQSIIIIVGHGGRQADKMLEKELRVLHLDQPTAE